MAVLDLPPTLEQVAHLQAKLLEAVHGGAKQLKTVLPSDVLVSILRATEAQLRTEPSLVELSVEDPNAQVFVFGDTHGHFPDVAYIINELGYPSPTRIFVFNGDYVDRGSWGVELITLLCCLKCAAPKHVYLLRGNHESSTCTKYYGYSQEIRAKYEKQAKDVYSASKKLFSVMPLAALIQKNTLVMHGGLFRKPPEPKRGAKRRKSVHPSRAGAVGKLEPGTLDHLRQATKGGMDPDGCGSSLLATDVLWSDPVAALGFAENDARGVGLTFGPDITEAFLRENGLKLIIRSHEGPDARDKRSDLPQVLEGYSYDHNTPAGRLVTVFSAPDYPQFQVVEEEGENAGKRYENLAAVAVLSAPDYATPNMRTFAAVKPRPKADAYYDFEACCDSDTELPAGSEGGSEGGSAGGGSAASDADVDGDEAEGLPASQSVEMAEAKPACDMAEAKPAVVAEAAPVPADAAPPVALVVEPPSEPIPAACDAMDVEEQGQGGGDATATATPSPQGGGGGGEERGEDAAAGPAATEAAAACGNATPAAQQGDDAMGTDPDGPTESAAAAAALATPVVKQADHAMEAAAPEGRSDSAGPQVVPGEPPAAEAAVVAGSTNEAEAGQ
ncbi:hypothetical protein PLESTB_000927800 [Pleodorina starrii]|uniref:Serine/threonine-protein phosphatase n=1 Tax=Pleodorina starrii TaxID=330485 RepID=A0A9W6BMH8_9CHLO|nr:hypothetical protein PLESTM_001557200 [Pleodorina starrii]GLC54986.1 hypothetical protein PLESTB_000927800 [Pleodorina starrii]GLC68450.1 hypothetical protein PLESTF_000692900 [Pleodorina starrii]